jgi:hypothetical protein
MGGVLYMKSREDFSDDQPLWESMVHRVRERAIAPFADFIAAYREIKTYRYLFSFFVKHFLRRKAARVLAFIVVLAITVHLVAPFTDFPFFPQLQPAVQAALGVVLLTFGIIGFWSHSLQTRSIHGYTLLLKSLTALTFEIGDLDFSNADRRGRLVAYLQKTLASFNVAFGQSHHEHFTVYAGVLLSRPNDDLVRFCQDPYTGYNPPGVLPAGQGAGGRAMTTGHLIYVPKVSHKHGIQITEEKGPSPKRVLKLQVDAFHQFGTTEPPFQSLLCVPRNIRVQGPRRRRLVLYVGSNKIGAFSNEFYLNAAQLEASLLVSVFERYFADAPADDLP